MINEDILAKDLETICNLTNSVYLTYDELHKYNPQTNTTYDVEKLINKLKLKSGDYITKASLADRGILVPEKGGQYSICTNSSYGGGVNYGSVTEKNINLFFFMDTKSNSNQQTAYHEAAHSLQRTQNLFNAKTIDKIYDFCKKGIKKSGTNELTEELASKASYNSYLKEMHSEAFGHACMMLRAESTGEFLKQAGLTIASGLNSTTRAITSNTPEYPGLRYYASQPIQTALVANLTSRRLSGETKEFLNNDGELDFIKLSKYIEKVVIKNAYSPKTFGNILDNDILGRPAEKASNWWRVQGLIAVASTPITEVIRKFNENKLRKQAELHAKENKKITPYVFAPLEENDNYAKAINSLCKIADSQSDIIRFCKENRIKTKNITKSLNLQDAINNDYEMTRSVIGQLNNQVKKDKKLDYSNGKKFYSLLEKYMEIANDEMAKNKDNPSFHGMSDIIDDCYSTNLLWSFRGEKELNPQAKRHYSFSPVERDDDTKLRKTFWETIKAKDSPLSSLENFSEIQAAVIEQFAFNPKNLANKDNLQKLKTLFAPEKKKFSLNLKHKRFNRHLVAYLHNVQMLHYKYQNHDEFNILLDFAAKNSITKLGAEIKRRNMENSKQDNFEDKIVFEVVDTSRISKIDKQSYLNKVRQNITKEQPVPVAENKFPKRASTRAQKGYEI